MSISAAFEQFRQTRTISSVGGENVSANTTVIAEPGRFAVNGTLSGSISAAGLASRQVINDIFFGGEPVQSIVVRYNMDVGDVRGDFTNVVEDQFESINEQFQSVRRVAEISGLDIPSTSPNTILDTIRDDLGAFEPEVLPLQITYPFLGARGEESVDFGFEVDIPTIPLPVVSEDALNELPDIPFTVTFDTTSVIQGAFGAGRRSITFDIPPSAFVDTVNVTNLNLPCVDLHAELDEQISNLNSEVRGARGEVTSSLDNIRDIRDNLLSEAGVGSLSSVGSARLGRISTDRISELQNRLDGADIPSPNISNLESELNDIRDQVQELSPDCRNEFETDIGNIENVLTQLETRFSELDELSDRLDSRLSGDRVINCDVQFEGIASSLDNIEDIVGTAPSPRDFETANPAALLDRVRDLQDEITSEVPSDSPCRDRFLSRADSIQGDLQSVLGRIEAPDGIDAPELGCSDVSLSIRNGVSGLEQNITDFSNRSRSERIQQRKSNLLGDSQELIDQIEEQVSDDNPCKSQLLSRVRSGRETLNRLQTRRPELVPCSQQFPNLESQIDSLEDQVIGVGVGLTEGEIQGILENAESISEQIDELPGGNPCRGRLSGRVESALDNLQRQQRSARVRVLIPEDEREQARQQVEQLRGRLENITGRLN